MRAAIIASGSITSPHLDLAQLQPDDLLIAADGGAQHCQALGLTPMALVGDLDSLGPSDLQVFEQAGADFVRYPSRKDETDLELAIRFALNKGASEIIILGGLGNRWDQSLANLLLAGAPGFERLQIRLVDGLQEVFPVHGGQKIEVQGVPGDTVSLIPIAGDATGVSTQGLEYPLNRGTLHFGATLGVSNVLTAKTATVELTSGLMLCIVTHAAAEMP